MKVKGRTIMIIKSHYNLICNECKNTPLLFDVIHQELYCSHCGLIHENNIIPGNIIKCVKLPINENVLYFFN